MGARAAGQAAAVFGLVVAGAGFAGAEPAAAAVGEGGTGLVTGQAHQLRVGGIAVHPTEGPAFAEVRVDILLNIVDDQARNLVDAARQLRARQRGEALLVYRLHGGRHNSTPLAMRALWAAHEQGRFFPLLDELMPGLQPFASSEVEVERRARAVGLDLVRVRKDSLSPEVRERLAADRRFAARFGADDAPYALVINGRVVRELLPEVIDEAVAAAQREARELQAQARARSPGAPLPMTQIHARLLDRHGKSDASEGLSTTLRLPLGDFARARTRTSTAANDSTLALLGPLPQPTSTPSPSRRRLHIFGHSGFRRSTPDTSQAAHRGPSRAKVKLIVFADFVSDDAARLSQSIRRLMGEFGGRVQLSFLHYPGYLRRSVAFRAAEVAIAAQAQGCFWNVNDRIYAARWKRGKLAPLPADFDKNLEKLAQRAGCNARKLTAELSTGAPRRRLYADLAQAGSVPLWRSPAVLINGRMISTTDHSTLRNIVREELKRK
jgi:predicted DsbA family dithiol-disulfide isomerase